MSFLEKIFNHDIDQLIKFINLKRSWNLSPSNYIKDLNVTKQKRCLSRIWDSDEWDINKQCINPVGLENLCFRCLKKKYSSGLVNEYPDEDMVLKFYRDGLIKLQKTNPEKYKNRNIDKEINLIKFNKYINKNEIRKIPKKKSIKKIKMSVVFKKSEIIEKQQKNNRENKPDIKNIIDKENNLLNNWWNSEYTDKLKIIDHQNGTEYVVARETTDEGNYLLNKNQVVIGEFRDWDDELNTIPEDLKNNENIVLDPYSAIPVQEYIIYESSSMYHELTIKKYRCYRYNESQNNLIYTNEIELLN